VNPGASRRGSLISRITSVKVAAESIGWAGIEGSRMSRHRSLRSELYRDARVIGNLEAAAHGPVAFSKRYARRRVYARTNGFTRSILRSINVSK